MASEITNGPEYRRLLDKAGVRRITGLATTNDDNSNKNLRHQKPNRRQYPLQSKIATWNVRTLFEAGKLDNLANEMARMGIHVLGASEVRWPGSGKCDLENATFYYSGSSNEKHRHGVGLLIKKELRKSVINFAPMSDRAMMLQLKGNPININIIQAYAPTADKSNQEIEEFYATLKTLLKSTKKHDYNIVMGDFNAKIGKGRVQDIVGDHGLGDRNERGDRLIQFCAEENLIISNTWYKLPPRRLYTWKSPQDAPQNTVRNQIDFILVNKRFRNSITRVQTYPGADIFSDHNPVVAKVKLRLKKIKRKTQKKRPEMALLKQDNIKNKTSVEMNEMLRNAEWQQQGAPENVETAWASIKDVMETVAQNHLLPGRRTNKQSWMTDDVLQLIEKRRLAKNRCQDEYRQLNHSIRREIQKLKEEWMRNQCLEIENFQRTHDHFNMHKKIREITGTSKKRQYANITDEQGKVVINPTDRQLMWESYVEELFFDDRPCLDSGRPINSSLTILKSEVEYAIRRGKSDKAPGPDGIHVELLKIIEEDNVDKITKLFNTIYSTGIYPEEWLKSTFIPIPKKTNSKKCADFRLISLMSHMLKIFLRIIHHRIYKKCEENISPTQFGFRNGMGTREALFSIQVLAQNCMDQRKDLYLCFIDFEKAFDTVNHTKLVNLLRQNGVEESDVRMIENLYWYQKAQILQDTDVEGNDVKVQRGVRQGCVLSPLLFNIYSEQIFQDALDDSTDGIKVNGVQINNIRFADDTVLLADSEEGLQSLLYKVSRSGNAMGIKINIKKTKTMLVSKNTNIVINLTLDQQPIDQVSKFKYLGCWINCDLNPEQEIKTKIETARASFLKLERLLRNRNLNLELRYRMLKCYVWPTLLYGSEGWTLKVSSMNRIEAFEMWTIRRILKIPWTAHKTNEEVLRMIGRDRELLLTIKKRKTAYLGHILRNEKYYLLCLIVEGKIEGKRGIGRKRMSWLRNIRQWTGMGFEELIRTAGDRDLFGEIVANLR